MRQNCQIVSAEGEINFPCTVRRRTAGEVLVPGEKSKPLGTRTWVQMASRKRRKLCPGKKWELCYHWEGFMDKLVMGGSFTPGSAQPLWDFNYDIQLSGNMSSGLPASFFFLNHMILCWNEDIPPSWSLYLGSMWWPLQVPDSVCPKVQQVSRESQFHTWNGNGQAKPECNHY
jgi:hypothetical protein